MALKNVWHALRTAVGITILVFILLVSGAGAAHFDNYKSEIFHGKEAAANEVLVKFRAPTAQVITNVERGEDVDKTEYVGSAQIVRFHSKSKNITTLITELSARSDVEYVEPNYIVHTMATPNDDYFNQLWGLQNTGQAILGVRGIGGADISATSAWDVSTGSKANVVAVIDTGIDYTHSDLAANVWTAPTAFNVTIGGVKINCAAGSHGFNAITHTCDPQDDEGHGTHVSGTIGAVGNNSKGVVGVNWNASIMGVKFLDASGSGYASDAIEAIEFVIQTKAFFGEAANVRVLSNSWGGAGFDQSLLDEIKRANSADMLFVAAAGNSGSNNDNIAFYPSNYDAFNVVAVAATDNTDSLAYFSNYGSTTVDLGAPDVSILSTYPGEYAYANGTSMATPHVSGAAILILSKCTLNTTELKANILNNVDPISSLAGKTVTGGRLNINKAIRACSSRPSITGFAPISPVNNTGDQSRTFNITVNQTVNVTWYINGTQVQFNESVTNANYTNTSASAGFWNITAIINNTNGIASQQWIWNVTAATTHYNPPPDSVTNLRNITYATTHINWTWTDPKNEDFAKVMVYLDGVYKNDVLKGVQYYNAIVSPGTYTIGTRTVDINGNINTTMKTHTATTILPSVRFINGTVMDSITKEMLSGVTVSTPGASTTSNQTGFYSLTIASSTYPITATYDIRYYTNSSLTISTVGSAVVVQDIELIKKPTGNITGTVKQV
jgi:subtilisin family serine protease